MEAYKRFLTWNNYNIFTFLDFTFSTVFVSEDTYIVLDAFTENTAYVTDAAAIESFNEESSADKVLDVLEIVGGVMCFVLDLFVTVVLSRHLCGEDWYNYYWWFINYVYFLEN